MQPIRRAGGAAGGWKQPYASVGVEAKGRGDSRKKNWSEGNCLATLQRLMRRWCERRGASRRGDRPRQCPIVRSEESDGDCGSGVKLESGAA